MDKLTKEILDYLVEKYVESIGKTMVYDDAMNSEQKQYYFKSLADNLVEPMSASTEGQYLTGDGNEMEEKMRAIRSSSAMTYNLFGNNDVTIGNKMYHVSFEKQLKTIKRSPRKANLDAFLESEDELLFFEMKMTEWIFNKPGTISENYLDREHYFDEEVFDAFESLIKGITNGSTTDYKAHYSRLKQYDGVQMFKHLLGVYNYLKDVDEGKHKKIALINCVWELPNTDVLSPEMKVSYEQKHKLELDEFDMFYTAAKPVIEYIRKKGIDFDIKLISVKSLLDSMEKTDVQRKFLNRYL